MKQTKILCLTDSFNSGGAQKQLMMLANGLVERMNEVATLQYYDLNFFSEYLDEDVEKLKVMSSNKILRVLKILYSLFIYNPDCIISFLHGPNIYAALYKVVFFWRKTQLITGERNLNLSTFTMSDMLIRIPHIFASNVVCNSNAQKLRVSMLFKRKVLFIPNGTYINDIVLKDSYKSEKEVLKLIVPARFSVQKNPLNLLEALLIIKMKNNLNVEVYWYGRVDVGESIYTESMKFINENMLQNNIYFEPPNSSIYKEIVKFDALLLPSFYEGCPNAIIDGMLCGMPILASNVSDNGIYLKHQKELLFEPKNPLDIAGKIEAFSKLDETIRKQLGEENRKLAINYFDVNKMVSEYSKLLY